jgi:hypothetical protein
LRELFMGWAKGVECQGGLKIRCNPVNEYLEVKLNSVDLTEFSLGVLCTVSVPEPKPQWVAVVISCCVLASLGLV